MMQLPQVRQAVRRAIPDLTKAEWDWAIERHYVDDCLESLNDHIPDALNELIAIIRGLPNRARTKPNGPRLVGEAQPFERDRRAPRSRSDALAFLLAEHAAADEAVQAFRSEVLEGRLLTYTDVHGWIESQANAEGPASLWLSEGPALAPDTHVDWDGFGMTISPPLVIERLDPRKGETAGAELRLLHYGIPGNLWEQSVPVRQGGVLDRLRRLTAELAERYGWGSGQATLFVLTGGVPLVQPIQVQTQYSGSPNVRTRITLDVDPTMTPQEVAEAYRRERKQLMPKRARPLSDKHAQLARFVAEHTRFTSWDARQTAWNAAFPQWAYAQASNFRRDALKARERILEPHYFNPEWLGELFSGGPVVWEDAPEDSTDEDEDLPEEGSEEDW